MKKANKFVSLMAVACLLVGMTSTVYGAWGTTGSTTNYISTATFGSKIIDNDSSPDTVMPGEYVNRVVNVENIGEVESIVRVTVSSGFENVSLKDENVILDVDTDHWFTKDSKTFYYKGALKGDEITKYPVLKGFTVGIDSDNSYKDTIAQMSIEAETMQYYGGSISAWGVSYKDLDLEEPRQEVYDEYKTTIIFNSNKVFEFNGSTQDDLFTGLKGLIPASTRTQTVEVVNNSGEETNLGISYMMSKDSSSDLRTLMFKYVTMTIKDEDGTELYSGPIGGDKASVPLGSFKENETKTISITASVDKNMTEHYTQLKGSVDWNFSANEVERLVQTGDSLMYIYLGIGLVCIGVVLTIVSRKKVKANENKR